MSQTSLLRLMMLLSPSFPVGGFAYSAGLEQAVADGLVTEAEGLQAWLAAALLSGPAWNDAVLLNAAHSAEDVTDIAALALALAGSKQRHLESLNLGMAFVDAVQKSGLPSPPLPEDIAYPVAIGAVAAANGIAAEAALAAFLHAFCSNQIQCGIRLGVSGQKDGVALLTRLETSIEANSGRASRSTLEDLGSNTILADISSMRHESLYSRIFRS